MDDAVTSPRGRGADSERNCPECGVEVVAGLKYCDFCGTRVSPESVAPRPAAKRHPRAAFAAAARKLRGMAVGCVAVGILVYVGNRLREQAPQAAAPVPSVLDVKARAAAVCEAAIRRQVHAPFRVIAFRSVLVAEERGRYVVSGTVELQSLGGELKRSRYFCRVNPDDSAGMLLDEARMD